MWVRHGLALTFSAEKIATGQKTCVALVGLYLQRSKVLLQRVESTSRHRSHHKPKRWEVHRQIRHPRTPDQFTWFGTYVCVNLLVEPENTIFSSPSRQGARGRNFTATDSGFSFVCGVELFVWIIQYFKRVSARSRGQQ